MAPYTTIACPHFKKKKTTYNFPPCLFVFLTKKPEFAGKALGHNRRKVSTSVVNLMAASWTVVDSKVILEGERGVALFFRNP